VTLDRSRPSQLHARLRGVLDPIWPFTQSIVHEMNAALIVSCDWHSPDCPLVSNSPGASNLPMLHRRERGHGGRSCIHNTHRSLKAAETW
jgi:hypothetical protein